MGGRGTYAIDHWWCRANGEFYLAIDTRAPLRFIKRVAALYGLTLLTFDRQEMQRYFELALCREIEPLNGARKCGELSSSYKMNLKTRALEGHPVIL